MRQSKTSLIEAPEYEVYFYPPLVDINTLSLPENTPCKERAIITEGYIEYINEKKIKAYPYKL